MNYKTIEGTGDRFEWVYDIKTNNPDFYQLMLESNVTLFNYVNNPCDLSRELEVMKIGQYSMNDKQFTSLQIDQYLKLTEIEIGLRSFAFVSKVEFTNNPNLKSITIKDKCFCGVKTGSFAIQHNPSLQSVLIGNSAATSYNQIEIDGRIVHT